MNSSAAPYHHSLLEEYAAYGPRTPFVPIMFGVIYLIVMVPLLTLAKNNISTTLYSKFVYFYSRSKFFFVGNIIKTFVYLTSVLLFFYEAKIIELNGNDFIDSLPSNTTITQDQLKSHSSNIFYQSWLIWIEFIFSVIYIVDFTIQLAITPSRLKFLVGGMKIINFIAVWPGLIGPQVGFFFYGYQFFHIIPVYESILQLRAIIVKRKLINHFAIGVLYDIIYAILTIFVVIMIASGIFWVYENKYINLEGTIPDFFSAIYVSVMTLATVGYGDFSPKSDITRYFFILGMFSIFLVIPSIITAIEKRIIRIREYLNLFSIYSNAYTILYSRDGLVVDFIREYLTERSGFWNSSLLVVIPDIGLIKHHPIVKYPPFKMRLKLLSGDILDKGFIGTLKDCQANRLVIFAQKVPYCSSSQEDASSVLAAWNFLGYHKQSKITIQLQNNNHSLLKSFPNVSIVPINSIKMSLMAYGCQYRNEAIHHSITPRASIMVLLSNLFVFYQPREKERLKEYHEGVRHQIVTGIDLKVIGQLEKKLSFFKAVSKIWEFSTLFDNEPLLLIAIQNPNSPPVGSEYEQIININPSRKITDQDLGVFITSSHCQFQIEDLLQKFIDWYVWNKPQKFKTLDFDLSLKFPNLKVANPAKFTKTHFPMLASLPNTADDETLHITGENFEEIEKFYMSLSELETHSDWPENELNLMRELDLNTIISQHILLCCNGWNGILDFVEIIRSPYMSNRNTPIVILGVQPPPLYEWLIIKRRYSQPVYLILGNPVELPDLTRAGINTCLNGVITGFGSFSNFLDSNSNNRNYHEDAFTLLIYKHFTDLDKQVIADLVHLENIQFLSPSKDHWINNPLYIQGNIFSNTLIDALTAECINKPDIVKFMLDFLKNSSFVFLPVEILLNGMDEIKTFGELLISLSQRYNILAIALWRRSSTHATFIPQSIESLLPASLSSSESHKNNCPYIYTLPSPKVRIRPTDEVVCLLPKSIEMKLDALDHSGKASLNTKSNFY